jgi:hypothetical protein
MALSAVEAELLLIQKFKKSQINLLQNGVRLVGVAGRPIDDLLRDASAARFKQGKTVDANTARKVVQIFRTGPELHMTAFADLI